MRLVAWLSKLAVVPGKQHPFAFLCICSQTSADIRPSVQRGVPSPEICLFKIDLFEHSLHQSSRFLFFFNEGLQTVLNETTVGEQNLLTAEKLTFIVMTYLLGGPSSCSNYEEWTFVRLDVAGTHIILCVLSTYTRGQHLTSFRKYIFMLFSLLITKTAWKCLSLMRLNVVKCELHFLNLTSLRKDIFMLFSLLLLKQA